MKNQFQTVVIAVEIVPNFYAEELFLDGSSGP